MTRFRSFCAGLALITAFAAPAFAQTSAPAAQSSAAARASSDLGGIWLKAGGGGRFTQSQWSTEPLPYTAAGKAAFEATKPGKGPRMVPPVLGNDPIGTANPPGLIRALIYPRLFEFIQTGDKVIQQFEFGRIWRNVYTDGRPVPDEVGAGPYWYGYSVGKWEGDTLVVNTLGLDERAWMDEWGTPFSADARFIERWRRVAPDRLELTLTVRDPVMYTREWTSVPMSFRLQPKEIEPQEIIFAPIDEAAFNESIRDPAGLPKK